MSIKRTYSLELLAKILHDHEIKETGERHPVLDITIGDDYDPSVPDVANVIVEFGDD